jgi:hypothetical protein
MGRVPARNLEPMPFGPFSKPLELPGRVAALVNPVNGSLRDVKTLLTGLLESVCRT